MVLKALKSGKNTIRWIYLKKDTICVLYSVIIGHNDREVDMHEFTNYNWNHLEYIDFYSCKINDRQWRLFTDTSHLFTNLKALSLCTLSHYSTR